jgi:hypothetical protein
MKPGTSPRNQSNVRRLTFHDHHTASLSTLHADTLEATCQVTSATRVTQAQNTTAGERERETNYFSTTRWAQGGISHACFKHHIESIWGRDSSVGITIHYVLNGPEGSNSSGGDFPFPSRPAPGAQSASCTAGNRSFTWGGGGAKRPGGGVK